MNEDDEYRLAELDEEGQLAFLSRLAVPRGCSKCYGRGWTGQWLDGEYQRCTCIEPIKEDQDAIEHGPGDDPDDY